MANPINTPDPLTKYKWWILSVLVLLLAAGAAFMLRSPATGAVGSTAILNSLKEELFALESDKIAGKISPAEYTEQKAALETVLKRALKRQGTGNRD
jgi:hypothetical protein